MSAPVPARRGRAGSRIWPVVRREYLERVRSKAFIIATIVGPLLMSGLMLLPGLLMSRQPGKALRLAVLDASGSLKPPVEEALASRKSDGRPRFTLQPAGDGGVEEARARLKTEILEGTLDAYLYLPPDALVSSTAEYHGKNVSNMGDIRTIDQAVEEALIAYRLAGAGLGADRVKGLMRKLDLKTIRVSAKGDREDSGGSFILSMVLLMILYSTLAMWGAALMNGVIEEKTSRVVEVVVSSVSPSRLFAGKLLGVGAAGLTQFLVWVTFMALFAAFGAAGGAKLPEIPPTLMVFFVVFFLLGFFLYGSLFAAVGAAVNSTQEAQSLMFPVTIPLILGVMFFPAVLSSPDSTLSTVISMVPFWAPLLMFLRISALMPPVWQIALSIAIMLVSIAGLTWGASRIYRVGILMYGKRPTFPEILRWVRHS